MLLTPVQRLRAPSAAFWSRQNELAAQCRRNRGVQQAPWLHRSRSIALAVSAIRFAYLCTPTESPSRELLVQREMPRATSNQTRLQPFCHAQKYAFMDALASLTAKSDIDRCPVTNRLIVQLLCVVVSKKFERKVRYSDLYEPIARCSLTHLLQIGYNLQRRYRRWSEQA